MFNIVVCAKQVPDTNEIKINPETGSLIRDGVPSILNPDDANALEEALTIKDADPDNVHVTVVSMGPPISQTNRSALLSGKLSGSVVIYLLYK